MMDIRQLEVKQAVNELEENGVINTSGSYDLEQDVVKDFYHFRADTNGKVTQASMNKAVQLMGHNLEYIIHDTEHYFIHVLEGIIVSITNKDKDNYRTFNLSI